MEKYWDVSAYDAAAYLTGIGLDPEQAREHLEAHGPDLALAQRIHHAHTQTLPFANVDVLLDQHPGVDPRTVQDQLLHRHRGGYCFEHAQLMAGVLDRLGYRVRRQLGRTHGPRHGRTHMSLRIRIDGQAYLGDPGFGFGLLRFMPLRDGERLNQGERTFSLARLGEGPALRWELRREGHVQHLTDHLPVVPEDIREGHLLTSRVGVGPFTSGLMAMRYVGETHVTVTEQARTVRTPGRPTERTPLDPEHTVAAVQELGIRLGEEDSSRLVQAVARMQRERDQQQA